MAVQAGRGFPVDGRVEHPATGRCGLPGQNEQTGGVAADAVTDVGERLQMLIGGQFPERGLCPRVDPAAELAECGVGVDGDDAVVLTELGEHRNGWKMNLANVLLVLLSLYFAVSSGSGIFEQIVGGAGA